MIYLYDLSVDLSVFSENLCEGQRSHKVFFHCSISIAIYTALDKYLLTELMSDGKGTVYSGH